MVGRIGTWGKENAGNDSYTSVDKVKFTSEDGLFGLDGLGLCWQ
jgi:hypothetical protein